MRVEGLMVLGRGGAPRTTLRPRPGSTNPLSDYTGMKTNMLVITAGSEPLNHKGERTEKRPQEAQKAQEGGVWDPVPLSLRMLSACEDLSANARHAIEQVTCLSRLRRCRAGPSAPYVAILSSLCLRGSVVTSCFARSALFAAGEPPFPGAVRDRDRATFHVTCGVSHPTTRLSRRNASAAGGFHRVARGACAGPTCRCRGRRSTSCRRRRSARRCAGSAALRES
jgi:hypothetical protein